MFMYISLIYYRAVVRIIQYIVDCTLHPLKFTLLVYVTFFPLVSYKANKWMFRWQRVCGVGLRRSENGMKLFSPYQICIIFSTFSKVYLQLFKIVDCLIHSFLDELVDDWTGIDISCMDIIMVNFKCCVLSVI